MFVLLLKGKRKNAIKRFLPPTIRMSWSEIRCSTALSTAILWNDRCLRTSCNWATSSPIATISSIMPSTGRWNKNSFPYSETIAEKLSAKIKTEHFLERQLPGLHTYRLGGSNYLTAAGEVAYFYKCQPRLVAAIRADTGYDALPVEIASQNDTLTTYFQADGHEAIVPRFYIEPLTHRLTSVAKKVPCFRNSSPVIKTFSANGSLSLPAFHQPNHQANLILKPS